MKRGVSEISLISTQRRDDKLIKYYYCAGELIMLVIEYCGDGWVKILTEKDYPRSFESAINRTIEFYEEVLKYNIRRDTIEKNWR